MRRILKALGALVLLLLVLALGALAVLFTRFPRVGPAPPIRVAGSPAQVERGAYLAQHVTVCVDCHSQLQPSSAGEPTAPERATRPGLRIPAVSTIRNWR